MLKPAVVLPGLNATAAVLRIQGLQLMFPQNEVRTLEAASDVDGNAPLPGSAGWINYLRQRWPVYCLSEQLVLQMEVPVERRACALFALNQGYLGLLCDDVAIMKQVNSQNFALPTIMRNAHTPIQSMLIQDGRLLCASSAQQLAAYLEHLVKGRQT
ncbi:MAG TPA: chemotaxis protein CheW [Gallionellaceae bacterium]|nr:chemotaxis protein CheW [Gallionellaceae bacterium]